MRVHIIHLLLYFSIFTFLTACSSNQSSTILNQQAPGTYAGTIPCADCEGIDYQLILRENNHFESSSLYLGKSDVPIIDSGVWQANNDSVLVLKKQETIVYQFLAEPEGTLRMLDQNGSKIQGRLSDSYILQRASTEDTLPSVNQYKRKRDEGIEFVAMGNEPGWTIEVDFDSIMHFRAINGDSLDIVVPDVQEKGKEQIIDSDSLKVSITEEPCIDDMSGREFSHTVSVKKGETTFEGCGYYITRDEMAYEGQWNLSELNGESIRIDRNQNPPMIALQSIDTSVNGFTGCNRLNGKFEVAGDSISFDKIVTTKMACPDNNTERGFLKALNKVNTYKIENEQLILMDDDKKIMVLDKAL